MDRDTELSLLDECLALVRERGCTAGDAETRVPVARYTDDAEFAREYAGLFARTMNLVAHTSELQEPGSFLTQELRGVPILLVRQADHSLKAFLNVCRHRGARVESRSQGHCTRFVCPYHAWTYATDGSLSRVRHAEGFPTLDPKTTGLVELSCTERAGLVFVCPTAEQIPTHLDADTATILRHLESFGVPDSVVFQRTTRDWNANWKLIVEGGLESYHFRIAHRDTVARFFTDNAHVARFYGPHVLTVLPRANLADLDPVCRDTWSIREQTHLIYSLFPNASLLVQEGHVELLRILPIAVDRTRIEITTLVPRPAGGEHSEKAQAYWSANHAFTCRTLDEDFELAESIQAGIASGANQTFRFATFESALSRWHAMIRARLDAAAQG